MENMENYKTDQMDQMIQLATEFVKWLEDNHQAITKISDINRELAMEFCVDSHEKRKARTRAEKDVLLELAWHLKLRTTEYKYLRASDFDLESGRLHIRRRIRPEDINISSAVVEIVREYISSRNLGGDDELFTITEAGIHNLLLREGLLRRMEIYEKKERARV